MSIYVGNLSYEVTQEDLNAAFAEYGSVTRVQLPTDRVKQVGCVALVLWKWVQMPKKRLQLRRLMVLNGWVVI